jgi:hypothetical protein
VQRVPLVLRVLPEVLRVRSVRRGRRDQPEPPGQRVQLVQPVPPAQPEPEPLVRLAPPARPVRLVFRAQVGLPGQPERLVPPARPALLVPPARREQVERPARRELRVQPELPGPPVRSARRGLRVLPELPERRGLPVHRWWAQPEQTDQLVMLVQPVRLALPMVPQARLDRPERRGLPAPVGQLGPRVLPARRGRAERPDPRERREQLVPLVRLVPPELREQVVLLARLGLPEVPARPERLEVLEHRGRAEALARRGQPVSLARRVPRGRPAQPAQAEVAVRPEPRE